MKQFCLKGLKQRCNRLQNQAKKQPKEFIIVHPCIYDRKIRLKEISQKCVVKRDDISAVFDYILDLWVGPKEPQSRGAALPFFMRHEEEVGRLLYCCSSKLALHKNFSPSSSSSTAATALHSWLLHIPKSKQKLYWRSFIHRHVQSPIFLPVQWIMLTHSVWKSAEKCSF